MFNSYVPNWAGFTNGAATVADVETGQILALVGSRDFQYPGFGQDNAATAYIQPGSTVKSFVYAKLFEQKPSGQQNYGSGSILKDENIDSIYGGVLRNADKRFNGDITVRTALATSRNIPAAKAMYISGVEPTIQTIHELGGSSYCTQGTETQVGLAASIGGCGIKQVDLVNAYTSLARGGVYKPQSSVLEVKTNDGEVLKKWSDTAGERVISEQSAYIVSDILTDPVARAALINTPGMNIPGVKTATKTGTSDKGGYPKDLWMASYSPAIAMAVWLGNPDTAILKNGTSSLGSPIVEKVMTYAHKEVYAKDNKWSTNEWFGRPAGIQQQGKELFPSWWNKTQGQDTVKMTFDRVSKRKATECTPELAKIELDVVKMTDPVTKKEIYTNVPDGYDADEEDNRHSCNGGPTGSYTVTSNGDGTFDVKINAARGSDGFRIDKYEITVGGSTTSHTSSNVEISGNTGDNISVAIIDNGYHKTVASGPTTL